MLILIRWLCQKPADLDLQCFENRIDPDSAGQWLIVISKKLSGWFKWVGKFCPQMDRRLDEYIW